MTPSPAPGSATSTDASTVKPPKPSAQGPLNKAQLRQWEDEGYLLLRNIIDPANIAGLRQQYAQTVDKQLARLKREGKIQDEGKDLPFETRFAKVAGPHANVLGRSWRNEILGPAVYNIHRDPKLLDAMAQLLDTDVVAHPVFNARPKLPGQKLTTVPWHQDASYFGRQSEQGMIITAWVPLVPTTVENGCLQVIPGSHKRGWIDHVTEKGEGRFLEVPQGLIQDADKAVTLPMNPGDALLFTQLTLHRSLDNVTDIVRWSIDIRFTRDCDDMGPSKWMDPNFKWFVRGKTRHEATEQEWLKAAGRFDW